MWVIEPASQPHVAQRPIAGTRCSTDSLPDRLEINFTDEPGCLDAPDLLPGPALPDRTHGPCYLDANARSSE
jgi:hypothetical protein